MLKLCEKKFRFLLINFDNCMNTTRSAREPCYLTTVQNYKARSYINHHVALKRKPHLDMSLFKFWLIEYEFNVMDFWIYGQILTMVIT